MRVDATVRAAGVADKRATNTTNLREQGIFDGVPGVCYQEQCSWRDECRRVCFWGCTNVCVPVWWCRNTVFTPASNVRLEKDNNLPVSILGQDWIIAGRTKLKIRWNNNKGDRVRLYLAEADPLGWASDRLFLYTIKSSTANNGYYEWDVPAGIHDARLTRPPSCIHEAECNV